MNATRHAERISAALDPSLRQRIAANPRRALVEDFGLEVSEAPSLADQRGAGGWCDGMSFVDHGVVLFTPSEYSRRENFTLTHELAHFLVEHDDDAQDWLADQSDYARDLEALCDLIAARLLLPDEIIRRVLGGAPPQAKHVHELVKASSASEPVCAIALAGRLPCQGAVLIADIGGATVNYASVQAPDDHGWPLAYPWPGKDIPTAHALRRLGVGGELRERSWWATPWGERQDYYLDAVAGTKRVHAVISVYDLWNVDTFHGGDAPKQTVQRPELIAVCACGFTGKTRGYPCDTCHRPYCPSCKKCRCEAQVARLIECPNPDCYMKVLPHQIQEGRCVNCA